MDTSIFPRNMKAMKGKILKKLKTIKPIVRVLQVNASDGYIETFKKSPLIEVQTPQKREEEKKRDVVEFQEPDVIDVSELMRDLEEDEDDDETEYDEDINDKENIRPYVNKYKDPDGDPISDAKGNGRFEELELAEKSTTPLSEIDVNSFRRPDLNSGSLFDPRLLAAFQEVVKASVMMNEADRRTRIQMEEEVKEDEEEPPLKVQRVEEEEEKEIDPLSGFQEKCPPGGEEAVILYTTTLRGIRKTFQDCNSLRSLLDAFQIMFHERDVSMHLEFRDELWRILDRKVSLPRLFIKGRHIGGTEEVLVLHEQGKFRPLFDGVPMDQSHGACDGCAGIRFMLCFKCNGSHKVLGEDGSPLQCSECNENGLIVCPICC